MPRGAAGTSPSQVNPERSHFLEGEDGHGTGKPSSRGGDGQSTHRAQLNLAQKLQDGWYHGGGDTGALCGEAKRSISRLSYYQHSFTTQSVSPAAGEENKMGDNTTGQQQEHSETGLSPFSHGLHIPHPEGSSPPFSPAALPPATPALPSTACGFCQVSEPGVNERLLHSPPGPRCLPGALGLGRMISKGVRGELKGVFCGVSLSC